MQRKKKIQLMICLGYNSTNNYFSAAFFAVLQTKTKETYEKLHINLRLLRKNFNSEFITVDFESAHIKVNKPINFHNF